MTKSLRRGARLGKYRLEKRLGEGGSAVVWRARDTIEDRRVALKIVLPAVVEELGRDAIEAEARLAARLEHPCVVGLRYADWIDSYFVLVSDLAQRSLDSFSTPRRPPKDALAILRDVAEGLAYAHGMGLIHRDIKPGNILLFEGRRARLADFGTARRATIATRMLTEVGTLGYMAPEQAYGRPKPASDVFSLALTGYEMFTGVLPSWPFEWPLEGHRAFLARCPEPVQAVLLRGLEVDLSRRPADGVVFSRSLERAILRAERSSAAGRRKRPRQSPASARRKRLRDAPDPFALEVAWFRKRYGKTFDARFDCHACEGPISESMSHCPWCGTTRNGFADVTAHPLVCPDCERGVRPEWSACPTCSTGRFESNGRALRETKATERSCRKTGCGAPLERFMRYCPACKTKIVRPWKITGLPACSRCRWPAVARWRYCAWCGRKNSGALQVATPRRRQR